MAPVISIVNSVTAITDTHALSCPEGMRNLQGNFTITDHDILTPQHVVTTIAYHSLSDSVFIGGLDTESLYPFIINYKTRQKMCVIVTSIYKY
jgi:hypothetical protein